ncbi:MAG: hypothetical protein WDN47_00630 [Candidatus Doudnabacteria bacterium]
MSQCQTVLSADDCDFGIEPKPHTSRYLDLVMDDAGRLHPAVTLRSGDQCRLIVFSEGVDSRDFCKPGSGFRNWQKHVQVSFLQEDPSCPEVYIFVIYNGWVLEHVSMIADLQPFMGFPFEDGVDNLEPEDEPEEMIV